ncbi:MAG: hypothetical protein JW947_00725 [Sedimentisphaerales bacterium]|nr:hypothetical protein [Sedimentisphaerales bacterium]
MTRVNITIVILVILTAALCVLCYAGKPIFTRQYTPEMRAFVEKFGSFPLGQKIIVHYCPKLKAVRNLQLDPYKELENKDIRHICVSFFDSFIALLGFIAAIALFVLNSGTQPNVSKLKIIVIITMIIIAGTFIRLMLAAVPHINFDMQSYEIVTGIVTKGGNVYAETKRYTYSPVWFWILFSLKQIQTKMPGVPFYFIVRSFLCVVDLLTLAILLLIAGLQKLPPVRTAVFFFLSPVSFLITGFHGQFENLSMLMILFGIYIYLRFAEMPVLKTTGLWLFATAGMIIKHNIFYELIICLHSSIKRYWIKVPLFIASVAIFLLLLVPYWKTGSKGIINNVFQYGSRSGCYGVTSLFDWPNLRYLFIIAMFVFPLFLKSSDIITGCLLGTLFFLTFATGMAVQYFVLPVALGALRPSKLSVVYNLAVPLFILGSIDNVSLPGFHLFQWNLVWVAATCWFIAEMMSDRKLLLHQAKP